MGLPESVYRDLFAAQQKGTVEHKVPLGRIDVLTRWNAVEVEPLVSWRKGARQALTYAAQVAQKPAIAIYGPLDQMDCIKVMERVGDLMQVFVLAGTTWTWLTWWHVNKDMPAAVGSDEDVLAALVLATAPKVRRRRTRPYTPEESEAAMRAMADGIDRLLGDGRV